MRYKKSLRLKAHSDVKYSRDDGRSQVGRRTLRRPRVQKHSETFFETCHDGRGDWLNLTVPMIVVHLRLICRRGVNVQIVVRIIQSDLDALQDILEQTGELCQSIGRLVSADVSEVTLMLARGDDHLVRSLRCERTPCEEVFAFLHDACPHCQLVTNVTAIEALFVLGEEPLGTS